MKNKTLALFGTGSFILSPIFAMLPVPALIGISVLALLAYTILAIVRIWRYSKGLSLLFSIISIIHFALELIYIAYSPSTLIIFWNIAKVIYALVFVWTIYFLWMKSKSLSGV